MISFRFFFVTLLIGILFPLSAPAWEENGTASWYGGKFQGRQTANGEIYDTYGLTAAHKTLPFGTIVEVIRPDNGMSVTVRINDRGPFVEGRIIDLTYAAAKSIDMIRSGTAPVIIKISEGTVIPRPLYIIQVGAWSSMENASQSRQVLEKAGLRPRAALSPDGIVRLSLYHLEESEVSETVELLKTLNYHNLWVHKEWSSASPKQ